MDMTFELLNQELQKIVKSRFPKPTLVQELTFKPVLEGKNLLVIAKTGLGKTESVMLPLFHVLMEKKPKPIAILYITPLRALNRDLLNRLLWWCGKIDVEACVRHGDTSSYERKKQAEFPPHLLITTPETLQAILPGKKIREYLKNVKHVVVDEIHELVDSKRGTQLSLALERLRELTQHDFQVIGLSATIGSPEKVARFLRPDGNIEIIKAVQPKAMEIRVFSPGENFEDSKIAKKLFISSETAARLRFITNLIKQHKSTLIFTNTREFAEILASRIKALEKDLPIAVHHSSLSKEVRVKAEKDFKEEKIKSIIATSSLQLGIDIGSVDLVLQYMSPRTVTQAIQRIGRSGHGVDRVSKGMIIATDEDDIFEAAVIARKALNEELEDLKMHEKPYDVLAHQIVGITLDNWKIDVKKSFDIVKKSYPYKNLSFPEFLEVCKQLESLGLIFLNEELKKRRRGFEYYFNQLSTIPDTKQFKVINSLDNSFVGVLDEEFVALNLEPGTTFVLKGEAYKIVSVDGEKILVEPVEDFTAAIPAWEGELIPVPFEVAQEVGKLRREIASKLEKMGEEEVEEELKKSYPLDSNSAKKIVSLMKKQMKYGIPDEKNLLVEDYENFVIIHACFGSLVNETIGRFLSSLLTARIGSVGLKTDPYRIILNFQSKNLELLKEILFRTKPEHLEHYLDLSITKTKLFEWKFIHVAKRFGVIAKDVDYSGIKMNKIIESYVDTPMFKEVLKELKTEKLDVEKAVEILKKIQSGDIKISFCKGLSPLGEIGLKHEFLEVIPSKPGIEIFEIFKKRILNTRVKLVCLNCGQWQQTFFVKDIDEKTKCKKCEAKLLAITSPKDLEVLKIVKKELRGILGGNERRKFERIRRTADLFLVYGKRAALVLAARGIGPDTAKRVLARFHENEDDLLKDVLEEERKFLRTRKYWSL
ncbi:MAG: DEAD/DEAH box helicase [Candidatus Aenigmatarchaeota archaeon]